MSQKRSTSIDEQIEKYTKRGMLIKNRDKAEKFLTHISYYRLGSYSFPFEKKYPNKKNRDHKYKENISFEDVIELYSFDFHLRNILLKYLSLIEVSFKTVVINVVSNMHRDIPAWFSDSSIVGSDFISEFQKEYNSDKNGFRKNKIIKEHHIKNPTDDFAPAWKTIEFMTFGTVLKLYKQIKCEFTKYSISKTYGLDINVFINYLSSIRDLRNVCAHGSVVFDYTLSRRLINGPVSHYQNGGRNNNIEILSNIVKYLLEKIDAEYKSDYEEDVAFLFETFKSNKNVDEVIKSCCNLLK